MWYFSGMQNDFFQLKSMTAYGRGICDFECGRITVEIQSVNRRFLEVNVSLPRLFNRFEIDVRKQIAASIGRGMVNVSVGWKTDSRHSVKLSPNFALARAIKGAWEELSQELWLPKELPLVLLTQEKDLLLHEEVMVEESVYQKALAEAVGAALQALLAMKRQEGEVLSRDLHERVKILNQAISWIESHASTATEKYRQKLVARLEELFAGSPENEERILREVAVYAEKVDIVEEVIRFKSHLDQFVQTVDNPLEQTADSRGKILDFLLQELLREGNTIGSKASDLAVTQHVVTIKSELERIREQVQNIE
ncbi:YicC/YloC family endoribonuclease [Chlamydiota bacterium]